jgi:proton-translocating NADH-quinone oxidoreductase chain N
MQDRKFLNGEFFALSLSSLLGMMVLISCGNFLTLYLGLELLVLPLYAMIVMVKDQPRYTEAAMKYFIIGSLGAGLLLFGISLVYGASGSFGFAAVAASVAAPATLKLGMVLVVVGLALEFGAVPFHMWLPDVYEGSPTTVTMVIGTIPKIAVFAMAYRILTLAFPNLQSEWQQLFMILAVLSLGLGNIVAIAQSSIKRMLAYSTIGHIGFILLGLFAAGKQGFIAPLFYTVVYAFMVLAAFAMIIRLSHNGFEAEKISDFRGLNTRDPWLAFMMLLIMLSLAGIPPMVGFYAKLLILQAVVDAGYIWLAVTALVFSVIGAYYYLRIIKVMYFDQTEHDISVNISDINEIWLSDRDRFSYQALTHAERLRKPMLHKHDKWHLVSWVEALKYAVAGIKLAVDTYGADQLGVLTSPNSTVEELILLQQLTRGFGSANIDHRLRQIDFSDQDSAPLYSNLGVTIKELASQDALLLIGSDLHKEQPIVGLKVRKISLKNGKVCVVNPAKFKFNFSLAGELVVPRADILNGLAEIAKELLVLTQNPNFSGSKELVSDITPSPNAKMIAQQLLTAGNKRLVVLGQLALMHPQAALIRNLANLIANILGAKYGEFTDGANAAGAWLTGCVPHRLPGGVKSATIGKNARQMLTEPMRCYILYAIEPEFDSIWGEQALQTLKKADFVVVISAYQSDTLLDIADVILPLSLFAEVTGTTINIDGKWQTTSSVIPTFGDSRPGWKILRVLGNLAQLPDFEYFTEQQVLDSARNQIGNPTEPTLASWQCPSQLPKPANNSNLIRIAPLGLYSVDAIVRRSNALQATLDAHSNPSLQINSKTADILKLRHGDMAEVKSAYGSAKLPVSIAESVADFSALIYQANIKTNILGAPYSEIEVHIC